MREQPLGRTAGIVLSVAWIAWPALELAGSGAPAARILAVGAVALAWTGGYLAFLLGGFLRAGRRATLAWLGALLVAAAALTVADRASWGVLFVYCATAGGLGIRDDRVAAGWIVACTAACAVSVAAVADPASLAITLAATTLALGFLLFAFGRLMRANVALRAAQEELADRRVDEVRLGFARDLHDLLGHSLSLIALKAQLARRLATRDPAAADAELADIEQVTRTALQEVREAVAGYRRPALATEIAGARSALDAAGIACEVEYPDVTMPPSREAVLAWAVREAATNVIRHSRARRCGIRIAVDGGAAELRVVDDGRGGAGGPAGAGPPGHGLRGLAERAAAEGGDVDAGPRAGGGYALRVVVPLGPPP